MHLWQIYCSIGAVIVFIAYMLPKRLHGSQQSVPTIDELEQSIQMFVNEVDREHSLLHKLIQEGQQKNVMNISEIKQEIDALALKVEEISKHKHIKNEERMTNALRESTMRARYEKLFTLYEQGKSVDYVAKQLNMHSGEVQLIIQLATMDQAEGNRHVAKV